MCGIVGAIAQRNGERIPEGIQVGHGVRPSSIAKLHTQGSAIQTGNPFDMRIEGEGFFQVTLPDGTTGYTRDGAFKVNAEGQVLTADGYLLADNIVIPDDAEVVSIGPDGTVSVIQPGNVTVVVGNIELANFANPAGLDARLGRNLLLENDASGPPTPGQPGLDGLGSLSQGFLENSNVQVVEEILQMIIAQRAYEANSKVIQTADEMLQTANNVRR